MWLVECTEMDGLRGAAGDPPLLVARLPGADMSYGDIPDFIWGRCGGCVNYFWGMRKGRCGCGNLTVC